MLKFSENCSADSLYLIEQSPGMDLSDLRIKASSDSDPAVLVSGSKTFNLRKVLTSNSLLVCENKGSDVQVLSFNSSFIECLETLPRVDKLQEMLPRYSGNKAESVYSLSVLDSLLQASKPEIIQALKSINAFEIDGFYYLLDDEYARYLLDMLYACLMSEGESCNTLDSSRVLQLLNTETRVEQNIVSALLSTFSNDSNSLDAVKICRFVAESMFKTRKSWNLQEFTSEWQSKVPSAVQPDLEMLSGLALTSEGTVDYFPKSLVLLLANGDIRRRFDLLFAFRKKWYLNQILPYVSDLATDTKLDALLLKYARASKAAELVSYTTRFPICDKAIGMLDNKVL